jgi:hypothetical protein
MKHSTRYPQTMALMEKAAKTYTPKMCKSTYEYVYNFLQTGQVTGSTGMFDKVDSPTGANHLVRAAATLLGHLGFPTHHAYYQNTPVDRKGRILSGANGPFVLTVPYDPGVDLFWSITRYGNDTRLPLNPGVQCLQHETRQKRQCHHYLQPQGSQGRYLLDACYG